MYFRKANVVFHWLTSGFILLAVLAFRAKLWNEEKCIRIAITVETSSGEANHRFYGRKLHFT